MSQASTITKEEIELLAARCYRSPVEFARIFLPEWFPRKMPWVHRGVWAMLKGRADFLLDFGHEVWRDEEADWTPNDLEKILTNFINEHTKEPIFTLVEVDGAFRVEMEINSSICIIMPRGSSKTTLINADNLHESLYHDENFFLYVSDTADHANRQLETVTGELDDFESIPANEMIHLVFGKKKPPRNSNLKWSEGYKETIDGVMFGAVGTGGQIRGFGKRAKRPGKITFDDLQDETSVESETQRAKDSRWFFRAARPAKKKGGRDIILGTLLHSEAILNKCVKSREFTPVRFGVIDRQGEALWDWWMSLDAIEEAKLAAAENGELAGWYMEYMSEFFDDGAKMFPESKLVYVHRGLENFVALSMALDPAISEQRKSAMAAFAVTGIEQTGHKHVLDFFGKVGMDPDAQIDKFFELHFKWFTGFPPECQKHGIEAIAFQRALIPMVRTRQVLESKTHGNAAYFETTPIFHGKVGKITRIKGIMKPLVWSGQVTFEERWGALHNQLVDFPGQLLDGPDVCAMAIALLDPYVLLNLGEEGVADLEKDTAPPLALVVGGDFRSAP
jgi:hypothetical protein